jgi:predicted esterase
MFGDPEEASPQIRFRFGAQALSPSDSPTLLGVDDAQIGLPDVVDGHFFGGYGGIAIRAGPDFMIVQKVSLVGTVEVRTAPTFAVVCSTRGIWCFECSRLQGLTVDLSQSYRPSLHPYQTRPITFALNQTSPLSDEIQFITIRVYYIYQRQNSPEAVERSSAHMDIKLPITHRKPWSTSEPHYAALRYTFLDYDGTAQYAMVLPPLVRSEGASRAVILATHGAGVETSSSFWTEALGERRTGLGWVVFATGKTPWGYDWHGPSAEHTFAARDALAEAVGRLSVGGEDDQDRPTSNATILVGHSNGGQGATYLMERYPDRFVGAVAAAGYLKIQSYVAFTQWASSHHVDPSLWGILQASLTPNDNDIHASNAAHVPFMLVHGTEDENVSGTGSECGRCDL